MIRQHSFENDKPTLYLVPTPIGNLNEMSPRAIEILKSVDVIACEDTRTSGQLLKHFDIHSHLIAYHNFNERESSKGILSLLEKGEDVALISDAGYPLISDPGYLLVQEVIKAGFAIVTVSGPNAGLNALVASGLPTGHYLFYGFLNAKASQAEKELVAFLRHRLPKLVSIQQNVQTYHNNVILGRATRVLWGKETMMARLGEFIFHVSARSFFQVNTASE